MQKCNTRKWKHPGSVLWTFCFFACSTNFLEKLYLFFAYMLKRAWSLHFYDEEKEKNKIMPKAWKVITWNMKKGIHKYTHKE